MKLLACFILIFFPKLLFCQEEKSFNTGAGYQFILNTKPIISIHNDVSSQNFHGLKIYFIKVNKNKSRLFYGAGYFFSSGSSQIEKEGYDSFYGNYFSYTRYSKQTINSLNFYFSYRTKSINKKNSFFFQVYIDPGIVFYKSIIIYSPEKIYLGLANNTYKTPLYLLSGGTVFSNKIFSNNKVSLSVNYGVAYQFIDLTLQQLNPITGLELNF